ncbi:MAG: polyketide cyclase [SAR202 cluster bacterium Io17-Chloro-G9]|nr:MAG: polyketide cyclase [SAR202 cluster bacterium Io17-Chloro-G9]
MKEIRTEIEIAAPPEGVWSILTGFASFHEWNPFMLTAQGEAIPGNRLQVRLQPPGGMAMTFKPTVLNAEPNRELRWLGHLLLPGLFDGEHYFLIEDRGEGGARFIQGERFTGTLVPLMGLMGLFGKMTRGFEEMNRALKARAQEVTP